MATREQAVRALWCVTDLTEEERDHPKVQSAQLDARAVDALEGLLLEGSEVGQTAAAGVIQVHMISTVATLLQCPC